MALLIASRYSTTAWPSAPLLQHPSCNVTWSQWFHIDREGKCCCRLTHVSLIIAGRGVRVTSRPMIWAVPSLLPAPRPIVAQLPSRANPLRWQNYWGVSPTALPSWQGPHPHIGSPLLTYQVHCLHCVLLGMKASALPSLHALKKHLELS